MKYDITPVSEVAARVCVLYTSGGSLTSRSCSHVQRGPYILHLTVFTYPRHFPILWGYFNPLFFSSNLITPRHAMPSFIYPASTSENLVAISEKCPPTSTNLIYKSKAVISSFGYKEVVSLYLSPTCILDPTIPICLLRRSKLADFSSHLFIFVFNSPSSLTPFHYHI